MKLYNFEIENLPNSTLVGYIYNRKLYMHALIHPPYYLVVNVNFDACLLFIRKIYADNL